MLDERPRAFVACLPAVLLLLFCIASTTFPSQHRWLRWLRLFLGIPGCYLWYACAYPSETLAGLVVGAYTVPFCFGGYWFMRMLEVCFVGFWDGEDVPRWVQLKWGDEKRGEAMPPRVTLPLPTTWKDRFLYALDSMFALRGTSFFRDRVWSWAPRDICTHHYPNEDRKAFLAARFRRLLIEVAITDVTEAVIMTYPWNPTLVDPLTSTSLSIARQMLYAFAICTFTIATTSLPIHFASLVAVGVFGMNPSAWPPLFNNPFGAHSLADFWAKRWHAGFQRVFLRLSLPIEHVLARRVSLRTMRLFRIGAVFVISAFMHLFLFVAVPSDAKHRITFWQAGTLRFFLAQPLGLAFEFAILNPITEALPGKWKTTIRRAFVWCWMLWLGRYYSDGYIPLGQFDVAIFPLGPSKFVIKAISGM
ncbi:hypothetical protein FRB99_001802 [Tulasnella sp. 403]|nr:hypothetical protein FRB99_001802 [Tulasnella sp. 403]